MKKMFRSSTMYEKVTLEDDILRGVAVCTAGEALGHGVHLENEFISDLVESGKKLKKGIKSRFGHPSMSASAVGTFVGRFKNFSLDDSSDAHIARADLYLDESAKETPNGDLHSYVKKLATTDAEAFGTSIVFQIAGYYKRDGDKKVSDKEDNYNDIDSHEFVELDKFLECDIVDSPAANPGGFFSSVTIAGQVSDILDANPKLFEALNEDPDIIKGFMSRYNEYLKRGGGKEIILSEVITPTNSEAYGEEVVEVAKRLQQYDIGIVDDVIGEYKNVLPSDETEELMNEEMKEKFDILEAEKAELSAKIEEQVQELTTLKASVKDFQTEKTELLKNEAEGFVGAVVEEGKLMPKFKSMKVAEYLALKKAGNDEAFALWKEELSSRETQITLGASVDAAPDGKKDYSKETSFAGSMEDAEIALAAAQVSVAKGISLAEATTFIIENMEG